MSVDVSNNDSQPVNLSGSDSHSSLLCQLRNFSCPLRDLAKQVEYIGYVYVQSIICSVGLLLNIINFSVFVRRCFQTPAFVYMSALSFVDGCTLLIKLPGCFVKVKGAELRELRFALTYYLHYFETPMSSVCETVSVWLTLTLAVERFVAMRYYSFSRTACTRANARCIIFALVAASLALNTPQFFLFVNHRHRDLDGKTCLRTEPTQFYRSEGYNVYSWTRNVLVQFAPLVGLVVANFGLLGLVQRHERRMKLSAALPSTMNHNHTSSQNHSQQKHIRSKSRSISSRRTRAQQKLTILLIVIIFLFLFGQIPQALAYHKVFKALFAGWLCPCIYRDYISTCPVYQIYRTVAQCLVLCAYSATFFVYLGLNRHFRNFLCSACSASQPNDNGNPFNGVFSDGYTQHRHSKLDKPVNAAADAGVMPRDLEPYYPLLTPSASPHSGVVIRTEFAQNAEDGAGQPVTLLNTEV